MNFKDSLPKISRTTLAYAAGIITAIVGIIVLAGWQFDITIFKTIFPNSVSMKANTAAAFLVAGLALIFLQRSGMAANIFVRFCGLVIMLIGFMSLVQHIFGWDIGFNEILFREPAGTIGTSHPGLMAPSTALNFLLLGCAFFVFTFQRFRNSFLIEFLLVFSLIISVIGLVGYITGLEELTGPDAYTKMAVHTAGTFIILCIGMLFTVYERQHAPISIEQKLFAGLTTAATVIIFISFLSVSSIRSLVQASDWVDHTHKVKYQIEAVFAPVLEVQSSGRGFILTGNEEYLRPREKASRELSTVMNNLRFQIADNPRKQESFALLEKLVEQRVTFSDLLVSTRKTKGEAEARLLFATSRGKMLTDSIRVLVTQMIAEEDRVLQTRTEDKKHQAYRNQFVIYLSLAVQLLLLVFIFVFMKRDVTGRRKAEEETQKINAKLESSNKELESFSYSVSHDLRAPLRHIDGFIDLLIKNNAPQLDETGLRYLNTVSSSSKEMGNLIDALLTFSRLNKTEIRKNKIYSENMVKQVLKMFSSELTNRQVEINISELPDVLGDENLIRQVWANLISNAMKYTRNKENSVIDIGGKIENGEAIFYVKDNGAGFNMKYADKLFGVFQRLHKAKDFEGIGIGLANVHRIVVRHGGKCRAEGEIDKGATFYFSLPIR